MFTSALLHFDGAGDIEAAKVQKFTATYIPEDVTVGSARAVLVLKHVPVAALHTEEHSRAQWRVNTPSQAELLQDLVENGHGYHVRLRSWLEELQEEVAATSFQGCVAVDAIRLSIVSSMLDAIPAEFDCPSVQSARDWLEYAASNVPGQS